MEVLDTILRIIDNVPFDTVIQSLAAAGVLSVLLQKFKKWLSLQSNAVINWINVVMSFVVVSAQYLITTAQENPAVLPGKALGLMSLVILIYHAPYIGIKSLTNVINDVKEVRERKARVKTTEEAQDMGTVPLESVQPQVPVSDPSTAQAVAPATPDEFAA